MHSVSAAFETAIAEGGVRLCELYQVELANGNIYYYTNHDRDITWDAGGNTYIAIPGLKRSPIRFNTDGSYDECEINLGIQATEFLSKVHSNILESAKITHKRIRWDASYTADEEYILNIWRPDVNYNASILSLRLVSLLDSLNIMVPGHCYQEPCNNLLFDPTCGLTRADYAYAGTATDGDQFNLTDSNAGTVYQALFDGGDSANAIARGDTITGGDNGYTAVVVQIVYVTSSTGFVWYVELSNAANFNNDEILTGGGNTVTVNGTPAAEPTIYEQGELQMTSGDNAGESRPVLSVSGSIRTVFWPFPAAVQSGDNYNIYPGCDYRPEICAFRFGNYDDNGNLRCRGFPYVPPLEETIM